jgi:hypothetical protein
MEVIDSGAFAPNAPWEAPNSAYARAESPADAMLARCSPASRLAARGAPQAGFGLDTSSAPHPSAAIGGRRMPPSEASIAPQTSDEGRQGAWSLP